MLGLQIGALLFFLFLAVPVGFAIGISVLFYLGIDGRFPADILLQRSISGISSFPMLALPLFIIVGYLMELGSTPRLMRLADAIFGRLPGGLAVANVGASAMFGTVSGSGIATIAAVGGIMGPEMVRRGYPRGYTAALMASTGGLGVIIPPSITLIIYGLAGNVSIGDLFLAAIVPGVVTALIIAVAGLGSAWWCGYGTPRTASPKEIGTAFVQAIPPMLLPILILGGILGGVFTPTEAAAVGVAYAAFLSALVYRELTLDKLPDILLKTIITSATILIIIAFSAALAWVITINQLPALIGAWLVGVSDNPLVIFFLIQIVLLLLGTFMEPVPIIIITTPVFLPIVTGLGFDPLVYGMVLIINMIIGAMSPPVAVSIYTAAKIVNAKPSEVNYWMLLFIVPLLVAGVILSLIPELTTFLPNLAR